MKLLIIGLVVLVVAVSGCTVPGIGIEIPGIPDFFGGGGMAAQGDVIVFKEVQAIPPTVKAGKTMKVIVNVQNVGKETITHTAYLFDYCPDMFNINGNLEKDKATILPNEIKQYEWKLIAQNKDKLPVKTSCSLKIALGYEAAHESTTTLSFINQAEYEKQLQSGTFRTAASQKQVGEGPLKAYIEVLDPQPVPAESTAKVKLTVKNTGGGYVASTERGKVVPSVLNKGDVTITAPGLKTTSCAFLEPDAQTAVFSTAQQAKEIKLIRKEASPMECTLELADKLPAGTVQKIITVKADYTYVTEKEVKVTVEP